MTDYDAPETYYTFVHNADDEAAVSAMLGRPMTVVGRHTDETPPELPPPPEAPPEAVEHCRRLMTAEAGLPIQLVTGPPGNQRQMRSTALRGQPLQWFVRLTTMDTTVAVQAMGGADGMGHETLAPIAWVYYPADWSVPADVDFARQLRAAVRTAAGVAFIYQQAAMKALTPKVGLSDAPGQVRPTVVPALERRGA